MASVIQKGKQIYYIILQKIKIYLQYLLQNYMKLRVASHKERMKIFTWFLDLWTSSPIVRSNVCAASMTLETEHWRRWPDSQRIHRCHCVLKTVAWLWRRKIEGRRQSRDTVPWRLKRSWAVARLDSSFVVLLTTCTARLWRIPTTSWLTTKRSAGFKFEGKRIFKGSDITSL